MTRANPTIGAMVNDLVNYGGDASGLICGWKFGVGGLAVPIGSAQAVEELRQLRSQPQEGHFIWLHFNLAHATSLRWLERHAGLSPAFFDALKEGLHSTRIERDEDALLAVMNDVHFQFSFAPSEIATLWMSLRPELVVTARQAPLRSIDRLRVAIRDGERVGSPVEMLERLLRSQADVLVEVIRGVTQQVDGVEDELLAGRLNARRARLGVLRRLLVRVQRLLAPEPASLLRLLQHPPEWISTEGAQQLREASEEFSVVLRDIASLQERIKLLQEEIAAMVNERTSRSLFLLTIVTVLALPINILAGLFGMNVGGVPLAQNPHGFWVVTAIVLTFTVIAGWLAFRRRDDI